MQRNNEFTHILPGQTIGIIGGGQLGRMMAIAARYMGYNIIVLDPTPNCPTAQVADEQIIAAYDDMDAIEKLTNNSTVVTYEFENVDLKAATYIEEKGKLPQGAYPLNITQNRDKEKQLIESVGLPVPPFTIVSSREECEQAFTNLTYPSVMKTCRGGYDGKGQMKLTSEGDQTEAVKLVEENGSCIIEQWIPFEKEISVIFTRSQTGEMTLFPIAENVHKDQILYHTMVPASISDQVKDKATQAATLLAEKMDIVGTFAIEMFVQGDDIYVNEMAPRPHNSGHYTIEACNVSQFTQHIRAVCGLPLVAITLTQPAEMINILGEDVEKIITKLPALNGFVHLYGKDQPKEKRKMGHITFTAQTTEELKQLVKQFEEEVHD